MLPLPCICEDVQSRLIESLSKRFLLILESKQCTNGGWETIVVVRSREFSVFNYSVSIFSAADISDLMIGELSVAVLMGK